MLEHLHNIASGRIFIVGTGASLLTQIPTLKKLKKEVTFGINGLVQWDDLPFTPTYYSIGVLWRLPYADQLKKTKLFVTWNEDPGDDKWTWVPRIASRHRSMLDNPIQGFGKSFGTMPTARTAPLTMIQVAAWMGYREFYLVGVELSAEGHCYSPKDVHRQGRLNPAIIENAVMLRAEVEANGGSLVDCSVGGELRSVLEHRSLEEVLVVGKKP